MQQNQDEKWMAECLRLARKGWGKVAPNPMVGAVIVKNGKKIAEGWHRRAGSDHAEIVALKQVGGKARGATLYVNLEPCYHEGLTPPCVDAVIDSGVKEVVIAMKDPNPLTNGRSVRKMKRQGLKVRVGVCRSEAEKLNEFFITWIKHKRPFIMAKCAQSLDGKIATQTGASKWITSETSRKYARRQRDAFDAIMVGRQTVLKDDPRLTGFKASKSLIKIVVDSSLKVSEKARIFKQTPPEHVILATTKKAPSSRMKKLSSKGYSVMVCKADSLGRVDLKDLVLQLAKRKISSILIEGGGQLIGSALKMGLVDKMHVYIAPLLIGDQQAVSSIDGLSITSIQQAVKLTDLTITQLEKDIMVEGYVHRHH